MSRIYKFLEDELFYRDLNNEDHTQYNSVYEALDELERLKVFKATFDAYELSKKQDFIAYENWQECEAFIAKTIAILKSRIGLNLHIIESEPISKQDKNNLLAENIGIEFAIMLLEDTD